MELERAAKSRISSKECRKNAGNVEARAADFKFVVVFFVLRRKLAYGPSLAICSGSRSQSPVETS